MDDLEQKSDEELLNIVKEGINSHIPQSQSSKAKRILEYRKEMRELEKVRSEKDNTDNQEITEIRIFLSYSSKNKEIVGEIKQCLSDFGFKVFLAHEDIEPSLEWQIEIVKSLKACQIFVPVITPEFNLSEWTDQESGMAFGTDKLIIPISINGTHHPHGFLAKYQALRMKSTEIADDCLKIIKVVKNDLRYSSFVLDLLLERLRKSGTFAEVNFYFTLVPEFDSWNNLQFNLLLKIATENSQVTNAREVRSKLPRLIQTHMQMVNSNTLKNLIERDSIFARG